VIFACLDMVNVHITIEIIHFLSPFLLDNINPS